MSEQSLELGSVGVGSIHQYRVILSHTLRGIWQKIAFVPLNVAPEQNV
jgi:hypothetical protein